MKNRKLLT